MAYSAIPTVAAGLSVLPYPAYMKGWGVRFRAHMRVHKQSQEALGEALGVTQGAVGHWLRGRNKITLDDFWALCEAAGADPRLILFGSDKPNLVAEIKQALVAHPELLPSYRPFEKSLRRSKKPRKARRKTPA